MPQFQLVEFMQVPYVMLSFISAVPLFLVTLGKLYMTDLTPFPAASLLQFSLIRLQGKAVWYTQHKTHSACNYFCKIFALPLEMT